MPQSTRSCPRAMRQYTRSLRKQVPEHVKKWAELAHQLAKDGYCLDAEVYIRKAERMAAGATSGLDGHVRTCVRYRCVRGRGKKDDDAACKPGYVLRCAKYAALPGLPVRVATRKPYQEFTYGRYRRGRSGARSTYAPDFGFRPPAHRDISKRIRDLPGPLETGPGRRGM
ncbi:MAG: hypothetical protein JSV86_10325 [Gemmatimonadota bacterium]|nr:MAG: hypothetical protein JSV86_10325 [Gemmatimonadota bacterium]